MAPELVTTRILFAEMRSTAFEGRCLLDEWKHCRDTARRRALMVRHVAVQQRWDHLFARYAAAFVNEARAIWLQGRRIASAAA